MIYSIEEYFDHPNWIESMYDCCDWVEADTKPVECSHLKADTKELLKL